MQLLTPPIHHLRWVLNQRRELGPQCPFAHEHRIDQPVLIFAVIRAPAMESAREHESSFTNVHLGIDDVGVRGTGSTIIAPEVRAGN